MKADRPMGPQEVPGGDLDPGRAWMLAFQEGDEAAFDRIVLHFRVPVDRFIHRYVQDPDRAEDLAQETFLRVYRSRDRYRPAARFRTWLFTIAVRLCLNDLRARRRERRVIVPLPAAVSPEGAEEDILGAAAEGGSEGAHEALERKELEKAVDAAIAALPPSQRSALLLIRFEELSYREIGDVLGVSASAVKSIVNRGREKLRESLGKFLGKGAT